MTVSSIIEMRGVRKTYREGTRVREVLSGVNLEVEAGECLALLGRSGSGKSTLLNLLAGIDGPDAGSIKIADLDLTGLGEPQRTLFRRRHVGFVYQFFNLIPTLTVLENVRLPAELQQWASAEATARASELLAAVDLDHRSDAFPDQLSGGEQQRVAIARALVHNPSLVLADEPTGNLDAETGRSVLQLLSALHRDGGAALVIVTHSQEVAAVANRVLVLQDGDLVEPRGDILW